MNTCFEFASAPHFETAHGSCPEMPDQEDRTNRGSHQDFVGQGLARPANTDGQSQTIPDELTCPVVSRIRLYYRADHNQNPNAKGKFVSKASIDQQGLGIDRTMLVIDTTVSGRSPPRYENDRLDEQGWLDRPWGAENKCRLHRCSSEVSDTMKFSGTPPAALPPPTDRAAPILLGAARCFPLASSEALLSPRRVAGVQTQTNAPGGATFRWNSANKIRMRPTKSLIII